MLELIAYIVCCILTAAYGSQRRIGFYGTLIVAVLVTPIPVFIVLLLTAPAHRFADASWSDRTTKPASRKALNPPPMDRPLLRDPASRRY